jgi:hypothetical protein
MIRIMRVLLVIIVSGIAWWGISGILPSSAIAAERLLWQSRDQFVALSSQDAGATGPALPNEHPATVTEEQLTRLLSALLFRPAESDATEPLFNQDTLTTLVAHLAPGLRQATPTEDLTFAVIGLHTALAGLVKESRVTTGRVFIKDGQLNLILGRAQQDVNEREDRRLVPFIPGSRRTAATGKWLLQTPVRPPGFTLMRRDWAAAPLSWQPLPAAAQPHPPATVLPSRSPAERLSTLNDLKEKGLITDEEYLRKRQEILQGI